MSDVANDAASDLTTPPTPPRTRSSWRVPAAVALVLAALGAALLLFPSPGPDSSEATAGGQGPGEGSSAVSEGQVLAEADDPAASTSAGTDEEHAGGGDHADGEAHELSGEEQGTVEELWMPTAVGFATDLAQPGEDWHQRVSQWTTPQIADLLSHTAAHNIRADTLEDISAVTVSNYATEAIATYTSGTQVYLVLQVQPETGAYVVTEYYEA